METIGISPKPDDQSLHLLVRQIRFEGKGINSYELVDPCGANLPPFDAGSHIDIHLGGGLIRQYSLCNSPEDEKRYVIAVLKDEKGRGGSKAVHEKLRVQDIVRVSRPRNRFPLAADAEKVILLAGGIGVTPLKSMAHALEAQGVNYELHYCARDAGCTAFNAELASLAESGHLHYHFDGGSEQGRLDIGRLLTNPSHGQHVYYCGPAGFMQACAEATSHWPKGSVHFEHFKAPERPPASRRRDDELSLGTASDSFEVVLAKSGRIIPVGSGQSIADALNEAGTTVPTSCCAGLCATCKVRYLEGEVEHKDFILSDDERADQLTVCVSRAKSCRIVLDL
ncbi:PDR/VanB family oxidoreductase [Paraburkholderia humisilvae]|uniref:Phthalate dioxygenase reductase n=1 Tax=Paraburkholderia humisilvae TaxID=627669 RepID=A0A6J5DT00_9BURK|nr:PDR/VanB family oxidoreductase [Paraburkholderia humisilvae]CAB3757053.1 Phthalate dioxygenase reductase [Paraburkholderia humisilvae]